MKGLQNGETIKTSGLNRLKEIFKRGQITAVKMTVSTLVGCAFSFSQITAAISPFGFAAVCALKGVYGIFALFGVLLGYMFSGFGETAIRYIAQGLIIIAVKWAFDAFFESEKRWALPIVSGAVNLAVGSISVFKTDVTVYDVIILLSECFICAGAVYFIDSVDDAFKKGEGMKSAENIIALSVCIALFLISLSKVIVGSVSVGHILAAYTVMSLSYSLSVMGGALSGLAIGAALSLSSQDGGFCAMTLSFGGMLSGLTSKLSKYAVALFFLLCTVLSVVVSSANESDLYFLYGSLIASILFLLTPETLFSKIVYFFPPLSQCEIYPNKYLASRLSFVSKALNETAQTITDISNKLSDNKKNIPDAVFKEAADCVCRRCSMKLNCWDALYNDTMDSFNHMIPVLRRKGRIESGEVPTLLRQRCAKLSSLVSEINSAHRNNIAKIEAAEKCRQIKEVVTSQFSGISNLLCEMSEELSLTMCDRECEGKVARELISLGLVAKDISCPVDRMGRKTVEFYCLNSDVEKIEGRELEECISEICGAPMQQSGILKAQELVRLSFCEKTPYRIKTASFQSSATNGEVCGDSFACAEMMSGFSAVILSDGMGQGKSAAIDSKMTVSLVSRFLGLGFSVENSLSLVNSAIMLKSQDETLSTLDTAVFDLYSGSVSFKKAGAAPSFLRRGKRISKIEMGSLPLGILGESAVRSAEIRLSRGDIVVLGSDGMCALSDNEIERILRKNETASPEELAQMIGKAAKEKENQKDDITVLVTLVY